MVTSDNRQTPVGDDELFPSFAALKVKHSELLQRDPEDEGEDGYIADVQRFFARGLASGALIRSPEDRRASQSILNYWVTVLTRAEKKPDKTTLANFDRTRSPDTANIQCPYPGPRAFREDEGQLFFGRQRQIEYILGRLRVDNFLAIIGPPGSGKSSLLRAGILPALKKDEQHGGKLFLPVIVPGSRPLSNLALALKGAGLLPDGEPDLDQSFRGSRRRLADLVEGKASTGAVLIVDQFEEVFTLCKDQREREAYVESLLNLVRHSEDGHVVVLSQQSGDFRKELERLKKLQALFEPGKVQLPKLGLSELSAAITKPAELVGLKITESVVKNVVQEIAGEPVGLALLQFTLVKLWEDKREGDQIAGDACAKIGCCRAVLADAAKEFFQRLGDENERQTARRMLNQLAQSDNQDEETPRPVRLEALLRLGRSRAHAESVLRKIRDARLVRTSEATTSADTQVELVHGSLRRSWEQMRKWLEADRRHSRNYKLAGALVGLLLVGVGALTLLGYLQGRAARGEQRQRRELASKLAARSVKQLEDKRLDLAMLLSLGAWEFDKSNESARASLLAVLQYAPRPLLILREDKKGATQAAAGGTQDDAGLPQDEAGAARSVSLSPDGRMLAVDADESGLEVWDVDRGEAIVGRFPSSLRAITAVFSPGADDRKLATVSAEDRVSVWSLASRQRLAELDTGAGAPSPILAFGPDGNTLAVSAYEKIILWDFPQGRQWELKLAARTSSPDFGAKTTSLDFSPDGKALASGLDDGRVVLWDVDRARQKRLILGGGDETISSVAFSPDGMTLAVGSLNAVKLWNLADNKAEPQPLLIEEGDPTNYYVSFSGDGRTIICYGSDGHIHLWDAVTQKRVGRQLYKRIDISNGGSYSDDGQTLASVGEGGMVVVWDVIGNRPLLELRNGVNGLAFAAEGGLLAMGGKSNAATGASVVWDIGRGRQVAAPDSPHDVRSVALNRGGSILASGMQNGSVVLREVAGGRELGEFQREGGSPVTSVAFSLDDKYLVALYSPDDPQSPHSAVTVWDFAGRRQAADIRPENDDHFTSMALSPDGKTIAVGSRAGRIFLQGVDGGGKVELLKKHSDRVKCLAFSPDGKLLASGGDDRAITLWDVKNGSPRADDLKGQSGPVSALAFSADGKTLAAGINPEKPGGSQSLSVSNNISGGLQTEPGIIKLWYVPGDEEARADKGANAKNLREMGEPLKGHGGGVSSLAFSSVGNVLASGSSDGMVILWNFDLDSAREKISRVVRRELTESELREFAGEDSYGVGSGSTGWGW